MGNFLSGFENGSHRLYEDYETEYNRHFHKDNNLEDFAYGNITATVFVIVMIILLLVLLICCVKTVLVCRRQKRVNDQRRRMMTSHQRPSGDPSIINNSFLRAFTFDHHHHRIELPGGSNYQPDYNDQPPAYDQVIGLPPSYDSIVILNGTVQSRATSVVGSVRNSVLDTVRSLRRGSRGSNANSQLTPSDAIGAIVTGTTSGSSEIGSTKSESLVTSVSNALVVHRQPMIISGENQSECDQTSVKKSMKKHKSEEDEESLTI